MALGCTTKAQKKTRTLLTPHELQAAFAAVRPLLLPGSFVVGTLTFGLKTAFDNFSLSNDVGAKHDARESLLCRFPTHDDQMHATSISVHMLCSQWALCSAHWCQEPS
jgi:hypothetical protein